MALPASLRVKGGFFGWGLGLLGDDGISTVAENFFSSIEIAKSRLEPPESFIFLCGGQTSKGKSKPSYSSGRDFLLRSLDNRRSLKKHEWYWYNKSVKIVLAEQTSILGNNANNASYPYCPYKNLVEFEIDIARLSGGVILFSEGAGSLAELGTFSQINSIAERLAVFISKTYCNKKSFVRDGPIRFMKQKYKGSVKKFNWEVNGNGLIEGKTFDKTLPSIKSTINKRIEAKKSCDKKDFGYKILISLFIIDMYGAARLTEIVRVFNCLYSSRNKNIRQKDVQRMLFSAYTVGWIKLVKQGNNTYYILNVELGKLRISYRANKKNVTRERWKLDIRNDWKQNDEVRFNLIKQG